MKKVIQVFKDFFQNKINGMTQEEYYYSQASDMVDLENRIRAVSKGIAPFQMR